MSFRHADAFAPAWEGMISGHHFCKQNRDAVFDQQQAPVLGFMKPSVIIWIGGW